MREVAGDLTGKRILDIGCSRGMLLERFRRYEDVEFWAIELEPESREIAERARASKPRRTRSTSIVGRELLARLPFPGESVDVVLAAEIIEHIVDTQGFVAEIARVLRPGGTVLFSTPNILWWKYRVDLLLGRYPDPLEYRLRFGEDFGHVRTFTPALLRELAEEAGLDVVRVAGKRLGPISSLTRTPAAGRAGARPPGYAAAGRLGRRAARRTEASAGLKPTRAIRSTDSATTSRRQCGAEPQDRGRAGRSPGRFRARPRGAADRRRAGWRPHPSRRSRHWSTRPLTTASASTTSSSIPSHAGRDGQKTRWTRRGMR